MTPFSAAKVVAPPLVCSVFSEALRAREEPLVVLLLALLGGAIGHRQGK